MAIVYDKLFALLKERGITFYQVQKTHLIGNGTWTAMKNHTGGPDYKVLCRLCEVLDCQPGDIMEYVPDSEMAERYKSEEKTGEKPKRGRPVKKPKNAS